MECLEWDGLKSLGFAPETLPVGNLILFPSFPWQTWVSSDGREGYKASDSIKTGISRRKSVLPVQFSCQEDPVGKFRLEHLEKPTPSHFFSLNSHIQLQAWLCLLQIQVGAVERIPCGFWLSRELDGICSGSPVRACLICNNAQSTVIPKEML